LNSCAKDEIDGMPPQVREIDKHPTEIQASIADLHTLGENQTTGGGGDPVGREAELDEEQLKSFIVRYGLSLIQRKSRRRN
jgi:hypothetical protein